MKQGRTLTDLAAEVQRRADSKRDYVLPMQALEVVKTDTASIKLAGIDESFGITPHAHAQLAEKIKIPKPYYDRILADGNGLWEYNVNHWLTRAEPTQKQMVRVLDHDMRALLSDSYQRIDNEHVAEVALSVLLETDGIRLVSHDVTDRKLYLKATFLERTAEIAKGDIVRAGVEVGNSEIGDGSLYVDPWIETLACLNGMRFKEALWRRTHLGRRIELPSGVILAEDTMRAEDNAILLKLRDIIRAASGEVFDRIVGKLRAATESEPVAHPVAAVTLLSRTVGLLESERESVLERLIRGRDYTAYGVANAVTNLANDTESYDRASELETIGSQIIELPKSQWREIAHASERKLAA